jgi:hypothetical protein
MEEQRTFQFGDGGSIPTSPLQFKVIEIDKYLAQKLNEQWHSRLPIYQTGFCLNSIVSYGLYYDGSIYGIAIWTNPVAASLPQHTWLELRRMALGPGVPKNTASRMLAVMARLIHWSLPNIAKLISYQDTAAHAGTIYKAAGWVVGHYHKGGSWNRPNSKNLNGKPRTRPDINNSIGAKVRWEKDLLLAPTTTGKKG